MKWGMRGSARHTSTKMRHTSTKVWHTSTKMRHTSTKVPHVCTGSRIYRKSGSGRGWLAFPLWGQWNTIEPSVDDVGMDSGFSGSGSSMPLYASSRDVFSLSSAHAFWNARFK